MRVFVAEYVCSTIARRPGTDSSRAGSLWSEAWMMLDAAVQDLARVPDVEVRALVSESFQHSDEFQAARWPNDIALAVRSGREEAEFRRAATWCEYALVIAPEFECVLEARCRWAIECGATLLGPSPNVVALCSDKLALAEVWEQAGVSTPPTKVFGRFVFPPPVVVKPRYGAGSQDTFLLNTQEDVDRWRDRPVAIVQPYFEGVPMSMGVLIGPNSTIQALPCSQDISIHDGRIEYRGGRTINEPVIIDRVTRCVKKAVQAVPGLFGYVGVDLVLRGETTDVVVEINPRLTTSYIGLRQVCEQNIMEMLLRVVRGEPVQITWQNNDANWIV